MNITQYIQDRIDELEPILRVMEWLGTSKEGHPLNQELLDEISNHWPNIARYVKSCDDYLIISSNPDGNPGFHVKTGTKITNVYNLYEKNHHLKKRKEQLDSYVSMLCDPEIVNSLQSFSDEFEKFERKMKKETCLVEEIVDIIVGRDLW